jgi:hypothetical protein
MYISITKILTGGANESTEVSHENYDVSEGSYCILESLLFTLNNTSLNVQLFFVIPQTLLVS